MELKTTLQAYLTLERLFHILGCITMLVAVCYVLIETFEILSPIERFIILLLLGIIQIALAYHLQTGR